jgi:hypothetical protein
MVAVLTVVTMAATASDATSDFLVTVFPSVTKTPYVRMAPFSTMTVAITDVQCFLGLAEGTRNIPSADISYLVAQCNIEMTQQSHVCLSVRENLIFCSYLMHSYAPVDDLHMTVCLESFCGHNSVYIEVSPSSL